VTLSAGSVLVVILMQALLPLVAGTVAMMGAVIGRSSSTFASGRRLSHRLRKCSLSLKLARNWVKATSTKSLSEIQIVSSYISSPNGSCKITLSGDLSLDVFSLYFLERCSRSKVSIYTQLQAACKEIPSTRQGGNLQSVLWFLIAERRRSMMQFTMRTLAMITGLIGVVVAFVINILYSTFHVLGRVTGITSNQSHFFFGLLVVLIGFIGSLMVLFTPIVGAVLLAVAGVAFFFIAGWWALLASPFLLIAAVLAYKHSRVQQRMVS